MTRLLWHENKEKNHFDTFANDQNGMFSSFSDMPSFNVYYGASKMSTHFMSTQENYYAISIHINELPCNFPFWSLHIYEWGAKLLGLKGSLNWPWESSKNSPLLEQWYRNGRRAEGAGLCTVIAVQKCFTVN